MNLNYLIFTGFLKNKSGLLITWLTCRKSVSPLIWAELLPMTLMVEMKKIIHLNKRCVRVTASQRCRQVMWLIFILSFETLADSSWGQCQFSRFNLKAKQTRSTKIPKSTKGQLKKKNRNIFDLNLKETFVPRRMFTCHVKPGSVVTYPQLKTMLSNGDIQLFDVRNPDEHLAGRIPNAVNIPLGTLEESLKLSPEDFQQTFHVKAPGKDDDNIVFHCKTGRRSSNALDIALKLGFHRARHFQGGFTEWAQREGQ